MGSTKRILSPELCSRLPPPIPAPYSSACWPLPTFIQSALIARAACLFCHSPFSSFFTWQRIRAWHSSHCCVCVHCSTSSPRAHPVCVHARLVHHQGFSSTSLPVCFQLVPLPRAPPAQFSHSLFCYTKVALGRFSPRPMHPKLGQAGQACRPHSQLLPPPACTLPIFLAPSHTTPNSHASTPQLPLAHAQHFRPCPAASASRRCAHFSLPLALPVCATLPLYCQLPPAVCTLPCLGGHAAPSSKPTSLNAHLMPPDSFLSSHFDQCKPGPLSRHTCKSASVRLPVLKSMPPCPCL